MKRVLAFGILVLCILMSACSSGSLSNRQDAGNEGHSEDTADNETAHTYSRCQFYYIDYFDTACSFILYLREDQDKKEIEQEIQEMLAKYHQMLDAYHEYDDINNIYTINQNAGISAVTVDSEMFDLLYYCLAEGEKIDYRTNIAFGAVTGIWKKVISDVSEQITVGDLEGDALLAFLPSEEELEEAAQHISPENVILDKENHTVYLEDQEMLLDVGSVAKGYVADRIAEYLLENGVDSACINLGGNLKILGEKKSGRDSEAWVAAIRDPKEKDSSVYLPFTLLLSDKTAIVTSGNYERYVMIDGIKYCHLVDPDTLYPVQNMSSVTIIAESSLLADFLSTALFTVDVVQGMDILQMYDGVEALWITSEEQVYYTEGFLNYVSEPEQLEELGNSMK